MTKQPTHPAYIYLPEPAYGIILSQSSDLFTSLMVLTQCHSFTIVTYDCFHRLATLFAFILFTRICS